jgi:hypothetical protein
MLTIILARRVSLRYWRAVLRGWLDGLLVELHLLEVQFFGSSGETCDQTRASSSSLHEV